MQSISHLFRRLARSPLFTLMTLLTLAVGIGANTAVFTVVHSILMKPLPYPEPDRLVAVWQTAPGLNIKELNASPSTTFLYREENRTFTDIGMWTRGTASVTGIGEPEQVEALYTTDGVLPVLGVAPALGRWFGRADDQPKSAGTVMLTYGYWQRRFGGDRAILGRRLLVDGEAREVIGVMPERFSFMNFPASLIVPLQINREEAFVGNFSYQAVARLKPGATIEQANADVARMLPMLTRKFKLTPGLSLKMIEETRMGPNVRPLAQDVVGDVGKTLWVLMGTMAMVLLIACANVANLLLVRAEGRQQELAIRAALGAGWGAIARSLLFESAMLGLLGGILGLGVAYGALQFLVWLAPAGLPRLSEIRLDGTGLLFTAAVSLLAGLAFGLIPVAKYAAPHVQAVLRAGGRTMSAGRERKRARNTLVVTQVALALVLLICAGLMLRTLMAMQRVAPGFTEPSQVLTMRVSIPEAEVKEAERVPRLFNEMLDKIAALPGVTSVSAINSITMDGRNNNDPIFAQDRTYAESTIPPLRRYKHVAPGIFKTLGNPLLTGRDISWTDIYERRPVVLVSDNLARELWGSPGAAIGKRVRESPKGTWREVIGVVGNERDNGVDHAAPTIVYWPMALNDMWGQKISVRRTMAIAVRTTRAGSMAFMKEAQQAIWSVDRNLPLADVRTVDEIRRRSMARTSFTLVMLSVAASMALLLGVIGIYGVIAYTVSQRTREIGIRMALGAQQSAVRRLFVQQGLVLAGIGVLCGLVASVPLGRVMKALLYEVSPIDPITYGVVPLLLLIAALCAAWAPAWRATRVEPLEALRTE